MGIQVRQIEGKPVTVGEKKLRPVVRVISWKQRRAVVRQDGISGFGAMAAWLQPVAILEETTGGHRRIPVRDKTAPATLGLLGIALAVPLVLNWLIPLTCSILVRKKEIER